jgi:hypothetical protein
MMSNITGTNTTSIERTAHTSGTLITTQLPDRKNNTHFWMSNPIE